MADSDWGTRAQFDEFYELDSEMKKATRRIVSGWWGTREGLIEKLTTFLPTTYDRAKVERLIAHTSGETA